MGSKREGCFLQKFAVPIGVFILFAIQCQFIARIGIPFIHFSGYFVLIFSNILYILSTAFLLSAACTDPGIIPPASTEEADQCIARENNKPINNKLVDINGQTFAIRYCPTCRMYRAPRVSHCAVCNVCVENFDHHCPYLGNCIGRRNYPRFIYFLIFFTVHVCFIIASHLSMSLIQGDLGNTASSVIDAIVALFLCAGLYPLAGLTGYHCFLLMAAMTTNEDLKDTFLVTKNQGFELVENPYSAASPGLNLWTGLCTPVPPTKLANNANQT